jgi:AcrR family transcriptional regulator
VARPRHITDERLLDAAGATIGRLGPGFTLADVAAEAKVAVGTVAQRFGNKRGLLVAMTKTAVDSMRGRMRISSHDDAVGAVVHALVTAYAPLDDPATAANNLAQLAVDLADDELRGLMAEFYSVMETEIAVLVERAAQDLPGAPPPERAARVLTALADGTAVHWSARPSGGLAERLRTDLSAVLDGWRSREVAGT